MTDPQALSQDLLNRLTASGELTPAWSEAFAAVPAPPANLMWSP